MREVTHLIQLEGGEGAIVHSNLQQDFEPEEPHERSHR
jgi:hypothetical protein